MTPRFTLAMLFIARLRGEGGVSVPEERREKTSARKLHDFFSNVASCGRALGGVFVCGACVCKHGRPRQCHGEARLLDRTLQPFQKGEEERNGGKVVSRSHTLSKTGEGLVCLASTTRARGMSRMFGLHNILLKK